VSRSRQLLAAALTAALLVLALALPALAQQQPALAQQDGPTDEAPRTLVDTGDDSVQGRLDGLVDLAGSRELRTVLGAMAFLGLGALLVAVPLGLVRLPGRDGPPGSVRRRPPGEQPPPDRQPPPDGPTP
jgi:hypothetical protein